MCLYTVILALLDSALSEVVTETQANAASKTGTPTQSDEIGTWPSTARVAPASDFSLNRLGSVTVCRAGYFFGE